MQHLTGQSQADPRYAVEPLDRRRAALAVWSQARDAARASRRNPAESFAAQALPLRATAAEVLRGTSADVARPTNADQLRATPGESLFESRRGAVSPAFDRPAAAMDAAPMRARPRAPHELPSETNDRRARRRVPIDAPPRSKRAQSLVDAGHGSDPAGRSGRVAPERGRQSAAADPLDRRLERARDMVGRARGTLDAAERALDHARDAIPVDWQERARERIPGLGRADGYVRSAARKLSVIVGTIEDIGEKADRMRDLARDVRELKEADAANDEARRERALSRLKAKRQED